MAKDRPPLEPTRHQADRAAPGFGPLRDGSMIQWKVQERRR